MNREIIKQYKCETCNGKGKIRDNPDWCWACGGWEFDQDKIGDLCKKNGIDTFAYNTPQKALEACLAPKLRRTTP
jgi:RecJ-like exonuclease